MSFRHFVKASNGVKMPAFMYGTAWKKEATTKLTSLALQSGFRGIDTANQHKHYAEPLVGEAIAEHKDSIKREELFLQTKFTFARGQDHIIPYDVDADFTTQVQQSFDSSLKHLGTNYIDSYVLHGPYSGEGLTDADWTVWRKFEELNRKGFAKMIGVSNINRLQLEELFAKSEIHPHIVQNRCQAKYGWDREVREFCTANNIIYQGFWLLTGNPQVVQDERVIEIAQQLNRTPGQVVFRFTHQIGIVPLTGTSSELHMREDLEIFDFALSDDDVKMIERIDG
uniref:Xylose reductase n=2 Tax=Hirondellea gigas TaxID=1518452 RepID=A0A6A7GAY4_9CRUS